MLFYSLARGDCLEMPKHLAALLHMVLDWTNGYPGVFEALGFVRPYPS